MLPPHIIEELRRREQYQGESRREQKQIQLEIPEPIQHSRREPISEERGIAIIDLM